MDWSTPEPYPPCIYGVNSGLGEIRGGSDLPRTPSKLAGCVFQYSIPSLTTGTGIDDISELQEAHKQNQITRTRRLTTMASIEDIWDAPLEPSSSRPAPTPIVITDDEDNNAPRPSKRPRSSQPLFLSDSDDERPQARTNNAAPIDIDAMFQDIENEEEDGLAFQPLAPDLDLDALRRQASARHANTVVIPSLTPHAILSSSPPRDGGGDKNGEKVGKGKGDAGKDGERKERKKIARMDEARLVSPSGFPALIKTTKDFVPKGKGHEVRVLLWDRLCVWGLLILSLLVGSRFEQTASSIPVLDT